MKNDFVVKCNADEKWATDQRKNLGKLKFEQEHEVDFIGSINTDELKKLYKRLNIDKNDLPLTFDVFERKLIYYGDRQVMDRAGGPKHGW